MITYEEQKKMIKELKQRPDIKKLTTIATVLLVLGGVLIFFGLGMFFIIPGLVVLYKRNRRIDEIIMMETTQGKTAGENKVETAPVRDVAVQEIAEREKKKEHVEELVRVSKHFDVLLLLSYLAFILAWAVMLLVPMCTFLGIDSLEIRVLDLLKSRSEELGEYNATAEKGLNLKNFIFCAGGVMPFLAILVNSIAYFSQFAERKIRKAQGDVILNAQSQLRTSFLYQIIVQIIAPIMMFFCILYLPVSWLIEAKQVVELITFNWVIISSCLLVAFTFSIIIWIYMIKERKKLAIVWALQTMK